MKTTKEVAHELNLNYWRVNHAIDARRVNKPPLFAGRYVFDAEHIAELKSYFGKESIDSTVEAILGE